MGFSVPVPSNVIWTQSDIRGRPEEDACGQRRWNRRIRMLTGPQSGNRKFQAKFVKQGGSSVQAAAARWLLENVLLCRLVRDPKREKEVSGWRLLL
mmetsp:Transcript_40238/g.104289  ORF Transcript_40238/g.104289 Transcript_40238/m.104289 type:complete len:96 (+) Transcript_40238:518-805(+)